MQLRWQHQLTFLCFFTEKTISSVNDPLLNKILWLTLGPMTNSCNWPSTRTKLEEHFKIEVTRFFSRPVLRVSFLNVRVNCKIIVNKHKDDKYNFPLIFKSIKLY